MLIEAAIGKFRGIPMDENNAMGKDNGSFYRMKRDIGTT